MVAVAALDTYPPAAPDNLRTRVIIAKLSTLGGWLVTMARAKLVAIISVGFRGLNFKRSAGLASR